MIFEWGLIILFCPPFIDYYFSGEMLEGIYTYSIDGIASTFLIIRVFIILKLYKHFSAWLASDAFNHNPKYGKPSILFAIKADFKF